MWMLNWTHAVTMNGYDTKASPYSSTGIPYWLSSTSYGDRPIISGHTAGEMDRDSILKNKYNILAFINWNNNKNQLRNYIMAKNGYKAFTQNAKNELNLCTLESYPSDVEDHNGCTVNYDIDVKYTNPPTNTDWAWISTYVMTDIAGNKRMVNMASDNEIYIRGALIALFGNLYKVSDEVST
jgi:hypothetical protein